MPYIGSSFKTFVGSDSIDSAEIVDAAVDLAHIQDISARGILGRNHSSSSGSLSVITVADGQVLMGNGSGLASVALSGNATMTNGGVVTVTAATGDFTVGDDLALNSDAAVITFGADADINITHVADNGLTTNGDFSVGDDLTVNGGVIDLKNAGAVSSIRLYCESSNAHYTALVSAAHASYSGNVTLTLPTTTDTLVGKTTTDTLTNKTLTSPQITTSIIPSSADGATIGSATAEFSDLLLADGAVVSFGNDQEVTLTHVADTGLLLSDATGIGTTQLQFGDSGTYIHQSADGVLDLVADTEIEINATTIDINGAVDISGNALVSGEVQTANIGFTDGDNAIIIADGGGMTISQDMTMADGKSIIFDTSPAEDEYTGIVGVFANATGATISKGKIVYKTSTEAQVALARANDAGTMPAFAIAVEDVADGASGKFLLLGHIYDSSALASLTIGGEVYVSEDTAGEVKNAAPDSDGDFVQIVGIGLHADKMYWNPDLTMVEVA